MQDIAKIGRRIKFFIAGMGSVFTLFPVVPTFGRPTEGSDAQRLAQDWEAIGGDFRTAISHERQEQEDFQHSEAVRL